MLLYACGAISAYRHLEANALGIVTNDPSSLELLATLKHEELDRIIELARASGTLHRSPSLAARLGAATGFASDHFGRTPRLSADREHARSRARGRALHPR
jgi:hypothetical protein